jgi:hypothetical protein
MMTYYEELGVSAEASREEIRQAYKRLVRLLHPDRCNDPATRVLAELQMRRLNGILEVVTFQQRAVVVRTLVRVDCALPPSHTTGRAVFRILRLKQAL